MQHLLDWKNWQTSAVANLLELAFKIKKFPQDYTKKLKHKKICLCFLKKVLPELVLSFEVENNESNGRTCHFYGSSALLSDNQNQTSL